MSKPTDFMDAIAQSQQSTFGNEPASLFKSLSTTRKPAADSSNPYGVPYEQLDWDYNCDVYLIYRPWGSCGRCKDKLDNGTVELPDDGDISCPHTRRSEYLATMKKILNEGWLQVKREEQFLQSGSVQVMVGWLVPKINKEKAKRAIEKTLANTSED